MTRGIIEHNGSTAVVKVNNPRPLYSAVDVIREQYGWLVDYEDPPYTDPHDLRDVTAPAWRAAHPNSSVMTIGGGAFQSTFDDPNINVPGGDPYRTVATVVQAYDASQNPGRFVVRRESANRVSVIGTTFADLASGPSSFKPVLDYDIEVPSDGVTGRVLLDVMCSQLSKKSGLSVTLGTIPSNMMNQVIVNKQRASTMQARNALIMLSEQSPLSIVWVLLWEPNDKFYALNVLIASKVSRVPGAPETDKKLKIDTPRQSSVYQ